MGKRDLELYSWIIRGKQRIHILKALDGPHIPRQIAEKTKLKFSNVSDVLKVMTKNNLVKCLNPAAKTGRLYQLTAKGREIRKKILSLHQKI